jgi:Xaa-Pro aminopeptidase
VEFTPESELKIRINNLQKKMVNKQIDGILIIQRVDLFYFSGTGQNAHLLIPSSGDPVLLIKKNVDRAMEESKLAQTEVFTSMKALPDKFQSIFGQPNRIGFELDVIPANLYFKYQKMLPEAEIVDASPLIREVRMIKSSFELQHLKITARMNDRMFGKVSDYLKIGISEVEFAGHLEAFYRSQGHQGAIRMRGFNQELFYGHLMSGTNLAVPSFFDGPTGGPGVNPSYPQGAGYKTISENEPIMVDYVGVLNGYIIDQARIFVFNNLPDKLIRAYETALKIKNYIIENAKPGIICSELYDGANDIAEDDGFGNYFMGYGEKIKFIGHGVGLELDEFPIIAKGFNIPLEKGMVFALEPKFVFPDEGAVGIEDTFYMADTGLEPLTIYPDTIQYL